MIKTERIYKIVESAVKQSLQAFIPKLNALVPFNDILKNDSRQKLIAHCDSGQKQDIKTIDFKQKRSLVLIGPEGDFTAEEINLASVFDFQAISLGETRLRSETAGLYVCQAASLLS